MTDEYYLPFGPDVKLGTPFGVKPTDEWLNPAGEPIRAAGDGIVVFAGESEDKFYADNFASNRGRNCDVVVLKTDGPSAPFFEYLNVDTLDVKSNERVEAGQILGLTGEESLLSSALPWRFNRSSRTEGRVNPRLYQTKHWPDAAALAGEEEVVVPTAVTPPKLEEPTTPKVEEPTTPKRRRRVAEPAASEPLDSPPVQVSPSDDSAPPAAPVDAVPVVEPTPPVESTPSAEN